MKELELVKFCKEHENWKELLILEPYYLTISEDKDYVLFKYSTYPNTSDLSLKICQEARGLILNKNTLKPVCVPFFKFFNYGEPNAHKIDWSSARVLEKKDGSLIKIWKDENNYLRISTNGMIDAFACHTGNFVDSKNITFGEVVFDILNKNEELFRLIIEELFKNPKETLMFELVSKYNKIVIDYKEKEDKLFYLGSRNIETLEEFECKELNEKFGVKKYNFKNLNECIDYLDSIKDEKLKEEGFVVVDKFYNRIKIKNPSYVLLHKMVANSKITVKSMFDIFINNKEDDLFAYHPSFENDYLSFKVKLLAYYYKGMAFYQVNKHLSRKEYAQKLVGTHYAPIAFALLNNPELNYIDYFKRISLENIKRILTK